MKTKRFIFTIDSTNRSYIEQQASRQTISSSKVLNEIISKQYKTIHPTQSGPSDHLPLEDKRNENLNKKSKDLLFRRSYHELLNLLMVNINKLHELGDIEFTFYVVNQLIKIFPENKDLLLLLSKLLQTRGEFQNLIETLTSNDFEKNSFTKYLLLTQAFIQQGDITNAGINLNAAKSQYNVWQFIPEIKAQKNELLISELEYTWISSGVDAATSKATTYYNQGFISYQFLCLLGDFYRDKGLYEVAKNYYEKALETAPPLDYYTARAYRGLGSVYRKLKEKNKSEINIFLALEISKQLQNKYLTSNILGSVGSFYQADNNFSVANKIFHEKYNIAKETKSLRERFYARYDLLINSIALGDFTEAEALSNISQADATKFKRKYYLDIWSALIMSSKNFNLGLQLLEKAKAVANDNNEIKQVHIANYVGGIMYHKFSKTTFNQNTYFNQLLNDQNTSKQLQGNILTMRENPNIILPS